MKIKQRIKKKARRLKGPVKRLLGSKRMRISVLFNAAFVLPLIYELRSVKEQADSALSSVPFGDYISYAIVLAYVVVMAWNKLHDDSKRTEVDDFEMQTQHSEMIAQREYLRVD